LFQGANAWENSNLMTFFAHLPHSMAYFHFSKPRRPISGVGLGHLQC